MAMIGWRELLILLVIVLLIFGTKRLTSGARDVGKAVDEFKKGMRGDDKPSAQIGNGTTTDANNAEQRERDDVAR